MGVPMGLRATDGDENPPAGADTLVHGWTSRSGPASQEARPTNGFQGSGQVQRPSAPSIKAATAAPSVICR
jgi:hypothetical protein